MIAITKEQAIALLDVLWSSQLETRNAAENISCVYSNCNDRWEDFEAHNKDCEFVKLWNSFEKLREECDYPIKKLKIK